ncbi:MAG: sensor histidine kinase [Ignavibacteriaceae bacterium]
MTINILNTKAKRISLHFLFWLFYIAVFTFQGGYYQNDYLQSFIVLIIYLPVPIAASYFANYYLVPEFLLKKKYIKFTIFCILSLVFFVLAIKSLYYFYIAKTFFPPASAKSYYSVSFFYPTYLISIAFSLCTIVFIVGFIKLVKQWFVTQQITQKLEKEKLEADLKFLRSQMNPHFLFNVLNNIYALALKKSDRTAEMILRLSSMLDYLLYETSSAFIPVEKELKLINDYIELEKLRYGSRLNMEITIEGELETVLIAPLVIFPFIENSFKHGASNELTKPWIKVHLRIQVNKIELSVSNSKSEKGIETKGAHSEGIGIKNVQRRLELIYPSKHSIEILDENNVFSVNLVINL